MSIRIERKSNQFAEWARKYNKFITLIIAVFAHIILLIVITVNPGQKQSRKDNTIFKMVDVKEFIPPVEEKKELEEKIIEDVFVEAQNRIKSMAIIHEMLYSKKDFVKINIKEYLVELTNYILNTFKNELTIELELLFEDFSLNIDYSITIGLIVTELFTNTIKYAFTDNKRIKKKNEKYQRCIVSIELKRYENICYLIYKDNGKGLSKNIDDNDTLGVHLINLLVKGRLNGSMDVISNKGLEYNIKFIMK